MGYQSRKAARSCNSLFLFNNKGLMLTCSYPMAGQHHDLFEIKQVFKRLWELLHEEGIETAGLFLNADVGFNSQAFRMQCLEMKVKANVAVNLRNGEHTNEFVYFNEQ